MHNNITWIWRDAFMAALAVLPAFFIMASGEISLGIAAIIGVLPVCLLGLNLARSNRKLVLLLGLSFGASVLVGSLLRNYPLLVIISMFVFPILASVLSAKKPLGHIVLAFLLPALAVGIGIEPSSKGLAMALVVAAGSVWAVAITFLWSGLKLPPKPAQEQDLKSAKLYGLLLGSAAATAATIGIVFNFEHLGWAIIAALVVMRPAQEMLKRRAASRLLATIIGAMLSLLIVYQHLPHLVLAILLSGALILAGGTRSSYLYITAGFTTFIVLTAMIYPVNDIELTAQTFVARISENLIGIGLAYFFGVVVASALKSKSVV